MFKHQSNKAVVPEERRACHTSDLLGGSKDSSLKATDPRLRTLGVKSCENKGMVKRIKRGTQLRCRKQRVLPRSRAQSRGWPEVKPLLWLFVRGIDRH